MAFSQYAAPPASFPAPKRRTWRPRRCLLKGCDQTFLPTHPQARYCSDHCRQQARRWRRWYHSRQYRASDKGKSHPRQQSRRFRARRQQRRALNGPTLALPPPSPPPPAPTTPAPAAPVLSAALPLGGEGQRPATQDKILPQLPCRRPGCYELFPFRPSLPRRLLLPLLPPSLTTRARPRRPLAHPSPAPASPLCTSSSGSLTWPSRRLFGLATLPGASTLLQTQRTEEGAGGYGVLPVPPFPFSDGANRSGVCHPGNRTKSVQWP